MKPEQQIRLGFSALATFFAALVGFGIDYIHHHNAVEHHGETLPNGTLLVTTVAPWMFAVPVIVAVVGALFRRRPLGVEVIANLGWLFAVAWPATCVWAWLIPTMLL